MSGSLCRDGIPVTTEELYKGEREENKQTKTQRRAEKRHISFVTQQVKQVDETKEINEWVQVFFLAV